MNIYNYVNPYAVQRESMYASKFEEWWVEGKPWTVILAVIASLALIVFIIYIVHMCKKHYNTLFNVTICGKDTKQIKRGSYLYPEIPEKAGYVFCGWFKDSGGTEPWRSRDKVKHDMTLYPKWVKES